MASQSNQAAEAKRSRADRDAVATKPAILNAAEAEFSRQGTSRRSPVSLPSVWGEGKGLLRNRRSVRSCSREEADALPPIFLSCLPARDGTTLNC